MMKLKIIILTISLLLTNTIVNALVFKRLTTKEGLSQNDVNCIFQDSRGYMWIGTMDGLNRYDGYNFEIYRTSSTGKEGISSNIIYEITEDPQGNLWVGTTNEGINKFDINTETFLTFKNSKETPGLFNHNSTTSMLFDSKGYLWTGNAKGVNRIKFNEDYTEILDIKQYSLQLNKQLKILNPVNLIYEDSYSNIWFGTNYYTLRCKNPHTNGDLEFQRVNHNTAKIIETNSGYYLGGNGLVYLPKGQNQNKSFLKTTPINNAHIIDMDMHNNQIWCGSRNGISQYVCLSETQLSMLDHFENSFDPQSLSANGIKNIQFDKQGLLWIGTTGGGVNLLNLSQKKFNHYNKTPDPTSICENKIRSIYEDSKQNLWFGTESGKVSVLRFTQQVPDYSKGFIHFNISPISQNKILSFREIFPKNKDSKPYVWVGCGYPQKLVRINLVNQEVESLNSSFDQLNIVHDIEQTNDSTVWLGTYGTGLVRIIIDENGNIKRQNALVPELRFANQIASNIVRSLLFDMQGNLWVGTDNGLSLLTPSEQVKDNPAFQTIYDGTNEKSLSNKYILPLYQSLDGKIWAGTMGGGVNYFEPNKHSLPNTILKINTQTGIKNNTIKSILQDNNGKMWFSTNYGLSSFDIQSNKIKNYDINDGLQDYEFAEIAATKRQSGEMIFGGNYGFNTFYPMDLKADTARPDMVFTELRILNKTVKPGTKINGNNVLDESIMKAKNIKLRYSENSFSIGFAALHYTASEKNQYKYMLEGFDNEWIPTTSNYRMASYTNIPPGKYTFKVIGTNNDGIEASEAKTLGIEIVPPLSRSTLAYIIYVILFAAAIYLLQYFLVWRANRRREVLLAHLETKQVEEMSQMKLQFFTNISHEFRTPLTLIASPVEELLSDETLTQKELRSIYKLIKQNINVMLRLVDQLLSFRKLEQKKLALKASENNITILLQNIHTAFKGMADNKQIQFTIETEDNIPNIWCDAEKIETAMYNLLSNAFKFTKSGGSIHIVVHNLSAEDMVEVCVSDTGVGIKEEDKPYIFERFYSKNAGGNTRISGTGIGLSYTKGIVELHKGDLSFESEEGNGTTFRMKLRQGKDHFDPSELVDTHADLASQIVLPNKEEELIKEEDKQTEKSGKKRWDVLVVEDNMDLRTFLSDRLSKVYNVRSAENGQEAWDMMKTQLPHIVVSDIMMPVMDGIKLCKTIKNDEATSHIPVVLLTAKNNIEGKLEGYQTGADGYIAKPFNLDVLKARVENLLEGRQKLKEIFSGSLSFTPSEITATSVDRKFMEKIITIIESHINDSDFTIEKLCKEYGITRTRLNAKLKALTGETSIGFVRSIKMKRAAQLILLKQNTISEIAWDVGYSDIKHFRNNFKSYFGVNPSEYTGSDPIPKKE